MEANPYFNVQFPFMVSATFVVLFTALYSFPASLANQSTTMC